MHSAELMNKIKSYQEQTKDKIIVTANNPEEYASAQREGFC